MSADQPKILDTTLGKYETDTAGSPVGVVRVDADQSYAGVGKLLQAFINQADQAAWETIKAKIDYTYQGLDACLSALDTETVFSRQIRSRMDKGQKLFFKPNLVSANNISPQTPGPAQASKACTEWPFVAALMRWFHDQLSVGYYQMAIGEAATAIPAVIGYYTRLKKEGLPVTPEAVIEGRSEDFYGGWGFYFVRKYLAESLDPGSDEDPMQGYAESVTGTYLRPGDVSDKLMVYDLNRISDDPSKGRAVEVKAGVNFRSITLHKALIGGDPKNPTDMKAYPGAILVNVPKLKVHSLTLITNAVKNLGIGLYPLQSTKAGDCEWEYARPHDPVPGIKFIPHHIWDPDIDFSIGLPKRNPKGGYKVRKTGGVLATMADLMAALIGQSVWMMHVTDGVEVINYEHAGTPLSQKEPEGLICAGLDPVATDLLCARYLFNNMSFEDSMNTSLDDGMGGRFPQQVPMPMIENSQIVTKTGSDCPFARDDSFQYEKKRGLGDIQYYVKGTDLVSGLPLFSVQGHLGRSDKGVFKKLVTQTLFCNALKLPWDLQKTAFSYMDAVDQLTGSTLKKGFLAAFDENKDGVVSYQETGKKGVSATRLLHAGISTAIFGKEKYGYLRGPFIQTAKRLKWSNPRWNPGGHDVFADSGYASACWTAYRMSQSETESDDPYIPGLKWGKGKWPSFQLAEEITLGRVVYGGRYPYQAGMSSFYGAAFLYADFSQNGDRYIRNRLESYINNIKDGREVLLEFMLYVPEGLDRLNGSKMPNVTVTDDPFLIWSAHFWGGKEIWPE